MSIGLDSEQLRYFRINGKIEFEDLISPQEREACIRAFKKRINEQGKYPPYPLKLGFDLFKEDQEIKPIFTGKKYASIALQLIEKSQIRFGFSQYLSRECYDNQFAYQHRKSCIKEFICGVCLCIEPAAEPESPFFPQKAGNALFFLVDEDFYLKFPKTTGTYIFILYTTARAHFSHSQDDPLNPYFRSLGYEQGDRLKEDLNPSYTGKAL